MSPCWPWTPRGTSCFARAIPIVPCSIDPPSSHCRPPSRSKPVSICIPNISRSRARATAAGPLSLPSCARCSPTPDSTKVLSSVPRSGRYLRKREIYSTGAASRDHGRCSTTVQASTLPCSQRAWRMAGPLIPTSTRLTHSSYGSWTSLRWRPVSVQSRWGLTGAALQRCGDRCAGLPRRSPR